MSTPAHHASGQQSIPTPYEDLLREILDENRDAIAADAQRKDRTGTGTFGVFGRQMRFDLRNSFPLITTKLCTSNRWRSSFCGSCAAPQTYVGCRNAA